MNEALAPIPQKIKEPLPEVKHSVRPGMSPTLTVAMVSPILDPGNKSANLAKFISYVKEASAKGADLVLFPEAALTGYVIPKPTGWDRPLGQIFEWAETIPGPSVDRLIAVAKECNIYAIMGMFEADTEYIGQLYNSAAFVGPEGLVGKYRKNSICDIGMLSASQWGLRRGSEIPVWEIRQGWRIGIVICYDCFMPEVPRVAVVKGADLILALSFSTATWAPAWFALLPVRALENQTGIAFTDVAGTYHAPYFPEEGMAFSGSRMAVEATGAVLVKEGSSDVEGMTIATFTAENLYRARGLQPEIRDRNPAAYQALVEPRNHAIDVKPYHSP